MYVCMCIFICVYNCVYICVYLCMYVYIYIYVVLCVCCVEFCVPLFKTLYGLCVCVRECLCYVYAFVWGLCVSLCALSIVISSLLMGSAIVAHQGVIVHVINDLKDWIAPCTDVIVWEAMLELRQVESLFDKMVASCLRLEHSPSCPPYEAEDIANCFQQVGPLFLFYHIQGLSRVIHYLCLGVSVFSKLH